MDYHVASSPGRRGVPRYVGPLALLVVLAVFAALITHPLGGSSARDRTPVASHATGRHVPPYYTVQSGDTFSSIALKTGLTVSQLEVMNPEVDVLNLIPGEQLKLQAHPQRPRQPPPKPLGPLFWIVQDGQSFGSIAEQTGIDLTTLEALNPHLNPATLQPGARVRLRPGSPTPPQRALTAAQLQVFSLRGDPMYLARVNVNVWGLKPPPPPKPKSPEPMLWTVRSGESFGSISNDTGITITELEALNPQLSPTALQPGDQVKLRR